MKNGLFSGSVLIYQRVYDFIKKNVASWCQLSWFQWVAGWFYGSGKAIVGRVHKPTNTAKGTTLHDSTLGKLSWFLGWYADYIFSLGFTPNYYTVNLGSSQCNDFLPGKPTKTWANAVMHIPTLNEDDFPYLSSHGEPIIEVNGESTNDINQTWGSPQERVISSNWNSEDLPQLPLPYH